MIKTRAFTIYELVQIMNKIDKAICKDHSGKMKGMQSLSTACGMNPYCKARVENGDSICAKCYAMRQTAFRKALEKKLERNTELLTKELYPVEAFPKVNTKIFRFESFGDLNNVIQLGNFINMCKANPKTTFALWTKNVFLLREAREVGFKKPRNLIIVQSSRLLNIVDEPADPWVDKVFTVWSKANKKINCGGRKCFECRRCYTKRTGKYVHEVVK